MTSRAGKAAETWIAEDALPEVVRVVESLSRRGRRLGTGPIELRERERAGREVRVEIVGSRPELGGYRVAAVLHHECGETVLEALPSEAVQCSQWEGRPPWCEHCGVRRRRHTTYVLCRRGEALQVGSSCLADFTGERDPVRALRQAQLLAEAHRRVGEGARLGADRTPPGTALIEDFLASVAAVSAREGFRSRRRARDDGLVATADLAWERIGGAQIDEEHRAAAARVLRWARDELSERIKRSEYEDRIVWALSRPRLGRGERYLVASALAAHARERSPHIAHEGERVEFEAWVELASKRGRPGRYGESHLHRLRDGFGRLAVWWATSHILEQSGRYLIRGRVRRLGRFGAEPATIVHRCRVERRAARR